jgi:hypothetical protein
MDSVGDHPCGWGCPIRRSMDQRALAPPHGLSQRATSFIASQCQGIHQMPLLTLGPGRSCPARRRASATGTFDRPGTSLHSGPSAPFPRQRTARTARPGAPRSFVNPYSRCPTSRTGTPEGTAARTLFFHEEPPPIPRPATHPRGRRLVEADGIEPTTPCLQSRCSPS